jgi:hypothetical protein
MRGKVEELPRFGASHIINFANSTSKAFALGSPKLLRTTTLKSSSRT